MLNEPFDKGEDWKWKESFILILSMRKNQGKKNVKHNC